MTSRERVIGRGGGGVGVERGQYRGRSTRRVTARSAFGRRDPGLQREESGLEGAGEHGQSISYLNTLTGSGA